jgi:hypothetical protein
LGGRLLGLEGSHQLSQHILGFEQGPAANGNMITRDPTAGQLEFRGGVWVEGPEFPCEFSVLKNSTPPKSQTFPHAYQHGFVAQIRKLLILKKIFCA